MPLIDSTLFVLLFWAIAAYLVGSIPFGMVLTRAMNLGDLRSIGSGNIGATNVLRTGSKKAAALTLLPGMAGVQGWQRRSDLPWRAAGIGMARRHRELSGMADRHGRDTYVLHRRACLGGGIDLLYDIPGVRQRPAVGHRAHPAGVLAAP